MTRLRILTTGRLADVADIRDWHLAKLRAHLLAYWQFDPGSTCVVIDGETVTYSTWIVSCARSP